MVRHETVGMQVAFEPLGQLPQLREVDEIVSLLPEAKASVVSTLNDMCGDTGQDEPPLSGHGTETDVGAAR
jgi:hypothetical protein